jgi:hypothetical protein
VQEGGEGSPAIRRHLTYANVMATVAVLLALGGGAYAAFRLPANSVRSQNIVSGQVKTSDIGSGAITSGKVKNGSLRTSDFGPAILGLEPIGRTATSSGICEDNDHTGADCVTLPFALPSDGRVLVIATGGVVAVHLDDPTGAGSLQDATDRTTGDCRVRLDGSETGLFQHYAIFSNGATNHVSMAAVTDVVPAGTHSFVLHCSESDGEIAWQDLSLSAVRLGAG